MKFNYFRNLKERLHRPGGPPFYFRLTNLVVAILMIVSAIVFFTWSNFGRIMVGVFEIIFGIWMIMIELFDMSWFTPYVQFMFTWRGRGFFYVFMGCLTLGNKTYGWVMGAIIIAIGIVYIVLSLTVKRHESYATSVSDNALHTRTEVMYDPYSVYGRKNDIYGVSGMYGSSVISVQQQDLPQPHYPTIPVAPQPEYTTTQYESPSYRPGQPDHSQWTAPRVNHP
ncbi:hypothetical protein H4S08_001656 [Coemansia sp. RSA 1365]|nr:hypothetical protein H4S08_001656 [Coemansia sp. RSA 1365]